MMAKARSKNTGSTIKKMRGKANPQSISHSKKKVALRPQASLHLHCPEGQQSKTRTTSQSALAQYVKQMGILSWNKSAQVEMAVCRLQTIQLSQVMLRGRKMKRLS
jgi:hypothetical protein